LLVPTSRGPSTSYSSRHRPGQRQQPLASGILVTNREGDTRKIFRPRVKTNQKERARLTAVLVRDSLLIHVVAYFICTYRARRRIRQGNKWRIINMGHRCWQCCRSCALPAPAATLI
jgi:hypothetical protein